MAEISTKSIGLYLMNEKGLTVLKHAIQKRAEIEFVVAAEDRNVAKDFFLELKATATENGIPFFTRAQTELPHAHIRLAIGWRWMIEPFDNLLVMHDSILPAHRGYSPLVTALIEGEPEIGVSLIFANQAYDSGDIIFQSIIKVSYPITLQEAIQKISGCYLNCLDYLLANLQFGKELKGKKQDEEDATYSIWRDEEDYRIEWCVYSYDIHRFIDSLGFPLKGASTTANGQTIRILKSTILDEDYHFLPRHTGKVLRIEDNKPVVICGDGLLRLEEIVDENGAPWKIPNLRIRFK